MDATRDRRVSNPDGPLLNRCPSPATRRLEVPADQPGPPCALLALADGSLWRGRSVGAPDPARGRVRALGPLVLVEGEIVVVLRDLEAVTPGADLRGSLEAADGGSVVGFAAAPGATLPLHGAVACAIARGEIGRP